jgi:GNAT superfamily N-acetyltransferase
VTLALPAGLVRQAERADAVQLAAVAGDDLPQAALDILIADGHVFLSEAEGVLTGLVAGSETDGALSVALLRILPGWRRRGHGSALLAALEERGRWAFHGACLASAPDEAARAFFFRRGYVALDRERIPEGLKRLMPAGTLVVKRL